MKILLDVQGKSQYDTDIKESFRPSACGPVTARVLMDYITQDSSTYNVNELYKRLGGTKIGLFKHRYIQNMRRILGAGWIVADCGIDEVIQQIKEGRPVAAKFDKWFTFHWRGQYEFNYHWVPIIGFELIDNEIQLIIHDNGGPNRESRIRQISYNKNKSILSFVKMEPLKK
ncbi:C39 family peptidase [Sporosarcina siberiensis]|uniref:C39 family peptidase n=1 Tax=Sporosarcina siberiensis TaxID=1365606 RepID=A0ABW4SG41_9BACL